MELKTALIAGATGLVGGELLSLLLDSAHYKKVISLVRKPSNIVHPKLDEVVVDFDHLDQFRNALICDDVFCCLGTTMKKAGSKEKFYLVDYTYPVALASLALKNKAQRYFLVTAMGADNASSIFYTRVKGEVENAIMKLGFPSLFIFRPSLILGERKEKRLGEGILMALAGPITRVLIGPLKKYRPIEAVTIARGMLEVSKREKAGAHFFESEDIKKLLES